MEGQFDDAESYPTLITREAKNENTITRPVDAIDLIPSVGNLSVEDWDSFEESDEDFLESYYDQDGERPIQVNRHQSTNKIVSFQPSEKLFEKYEKKIDFGHKISTPFGRDTSNSMFIGGRKTGDDKSRVRDKQDRATSEQVMDPRTRMILFKLMSRGFIEQINGCVSTGKEANVYHATDKNGRDLALKIYKTSILVFKDRDKYVTGEFRFRHGYSRHNPRKMVRTWAEKEMRNLSRLFQEGLLCPEPLLLRSHVLLMTFIGKEGWPAPLLKDVDISESKARELYRDMVIMMRQMYNKCHLVHADLSEFNILYFNGKAYVIDVSQSVEHDHPSALEFLRKDATNITDFFHKKGVSTLTVKELFDFVVDPTISEENMDAVLDRMSEKAAERQEMTPEEKIQEEVFKKTYIPKRLDEVTHYERDINQVKTGQLKEILYGPVTGMKQDLTGPQKVPIILPEEEQQEKEESESDDGSSESEEGRKEFTSSARPRDESPESKKERKKAVKEEKAEKRKNKVPKHVKKRKEKIGRGSFKK
ncbi:serine/threonine-protein kinase RIO1-like isoform X2 [Artemia franciscana]|uniref:Serine/threonine-protein kinase RIO1 n=1 Tax=Artemia franciscana TaxID=6661 RepID=A0AA88LID0_ARTSF|nr:hypothetical protein QYM36_003167 [Artemia franciscana]